MPLLDALHALLIEQKAKLLPKHPLAEAIGYTLNQWRELTLFTTDGAVPIHNNLAEQQMKRIALLRKNALFAGSPRGGETAAILSSLTSTCRRHEINPQAYLTQLLANLPDTPISRIDEWRPDHWKETSAKETSAKDYVGDAARSVIPLANLSLTPRPIRRLQRQPPEEIKGAVSFNGHVKSWVASFRYDVSSRGNNNTFSKKMSLLSRATK